MISNWCLVSQGPWSKRRKHQVVAWKDQILLLGGFDGESSYDLNDVWRWQGNQWTLVTDHAGWSGRDGHTAVVLHDSIFVLGGTDDPFQCKNDVWQSSDGGNTWIEKTQHASWPERWQHAACKHGERMFLSGGWGEKFFNDVWYSNDGINWILVCPSAPWKPRMFHSMVSFQGKLFVFGGHDGKTQLRDVWLSRDDGASWTQVTSSAPWQSRQGQATAVSKDSIYMMGGFGGAQRFNDFWKTSDGVTWTLLSEQCAWTARQGHAATFFQGSVFIVGGFDEAGYSNSVYNCLVDAGEAPALSASGTSNSVTVDKGAEAVGSTSSSEWLSSLPNCVSHLEELYSLRDRRDKMVSDIVYSVGLVTKVFKMPDVHSRKRTSSSTDSRIENMESFINRASNSSSPRPASNELDFSRFGSPFRENALSSAATKDNKAFSLGEDMQLQLWQKISELSVDYHEDESFSHNEVFQTGTPREGALRSGSAALHEAIEQDKRKILKIQQSIRRSAESEQAEPISSLIDQRAALAKSSMSQVAALEKHLANIQSLYESRQQDLLQVINQLEDTQRDYHNAFLQPSMSSAAAVGDHSIPTRTESSKGKKRSWEQVMARSAEIVHLNNDAASDAVIHALKTSFEEIARSSLEIAQLLSPSSGGSSSTAALHAVPASAQLEKVISRITDVYAQQGQLSASLVESTDREVSALRSTLEELVSLLKDAVNEGIDMVQLAYSQCMSTSTEITRLYDDLKEWETQLRQWQEPESLKDTCDTMVAEVAALEDTLLQWENQRIDVKSAMEKAMLTMNRSKSMRVASDVNAASASSSSLSSSSSASNGGEIERLREQLSLTERQSKLARRALRTWYRSHRHFAVNTAPELFLVLPDLRAPGSVLGDGGFASSANIPRRQLQEYDDVAVFTDPDSTATPAVGGNLSKMVAAGRHLLLKASYEGQEVILKGFAMHNNEQRKGMDREIEILSRLKSDLVIHPQAIVDASSDASDPTLQITLFIEYPYYPRGNLSTWLKQEERKPWELQGIARQVLFAIMYLHDHGIVHKDIKPSNILMREDGRIILTDFELARVVVTTHHKSSHPSSSSSSSSSVPSSSSLAVELDDEACTVTRSGTSGYMAPEVETGQSTGLSSDMFSFGCLLYFMHFPREFSQLIPSQVSFPRGANANNDAELCDLIAQLLAIDPTQRPTAATALTHAYFRATFVDRLLQEGEIVEQDRKLDAVRNLLSRTRAANRNVFDRVTVSRDTVVDDVLKYFQEVPVDNLRKHLKVTFANEPGVDEGGLLTEMFNLFFDQVFRPSVGLFEDCNDSGGSSAAAALASSPLVPRTSTSFVRDLLMSSESSTDTAFVADENTFLSSTGGVPAVSSSSSNNTEGDIILPHQHLPATHLSHLRAVGRAMVKALYEGRRIGNRLCPSVLKFFTGAAPTILDLQLYDAQAAKSLRWLLTTVGVEELGLHFEEVGQAALGLVTDGNKAQYVRMKIQHILVDCRLAQLTALKTGFLEALQGLSTEAAPFLTLLSHTDWRIMLCGDTVINAHHIIAALKFANFPRRSKIPQWLTEILLSFSEDYLRKFLVFVTGSPSLSNSFLSSSSSSATVKINVRHQPRSAALPTAHTCFYFLDIPDYDDRAVFQNKLIFAIQNANTFEIV